MPITRIARARNRRKGLVPPLTAENPEAMRYIKGFRGAFIPFQHIGIDVLVPVEIQVAHVDGKDELDIQMCNFDILDVPYSLLEKDKCCFQRFKITVQISELKSVIHYWDSRENYDLHCFAFYQKAPVRINGRPQEFPLLCFKVDKEKEHGEESNNNSNNNDNSSTDKNSFFQTDSSSDNQTNQSKEENDENEHKSSVGNDDKSQDEENLDNKDNIENNNEPEECKDEEQENYYSESPEEFELFMAFHGFLRNINFSSDERNVWARFNELKDVVIMEKMNYSDKLPDKYVTKPKKYLERLCELSNTEMIDIKEYRKKKEKAIKILNENEGNNCLANINMDIWRIPYFSPYMIPSHVCLSPFSCEETSLDYTRYDSLDGNTNPYYHGNYNVKSLKKYVPDYFNTITDEEFENVGPLMFPFLFSIQSLLLTYVNATGEEYVQGFADLCVAATSLAFLDVTKYNIKKNIERYNFLNNNSIQIYKSVDGQDMILLDDFTKVRKSIKIEKLLEIESKAYCLLTTLLDLNKERFLLTSVNKDTDFIKKYVKLITENGENKYLDENFSYENLVTMFILMGVRQMKNEVEFAKILIYLIEDKDKFDFKLGTLVLAFLKIIAESKPNNSFKFMELLPLLDGVMDADEVIVKAKDMEERIRKYEQEQSIQFSSSRQDNNSRNIDNENPIDVQGIDININSSNNNNNNNNDSNNVETSSYRTMGSLTSSKRSDNPFALDQNVDIPSYKSSMNIGRVENSNNSSSYSHKAHDDYDSIMDKMDSGNESNSSFGNSLDQDFDTNNLKMKKDIDSEDSLANMNEGSKYTSMHDQKYSNNNDETSNSFFHYNSDDEL